MSIFHEIDVYLKKKTSNFHRVQDVTVTNEFRVIIMCVIYKECFKIKNIQPIGISVGIVITIIIIIKSYFSTNLLFSEERYTSVTIIHII